MNTIMSPYNWNSNENERFSLWYVTSAKLPEVRQLVKAAGGTMKHTPVPHECGAVRVHITLSAFSWAALAPKIKTLREALAALHLQLEKE
jgi:hypothetical protein